jgi:hypothetical protein
MTAGSRLGWIYELNTIIKNSKSLASKLLQSINLVGLDELDLLEALEDTKKKKRKI